MSKPAGYEQVPSSRYDSPVPPPAFSGIRIFQKSLFKQYGMSFRVLVFCVSAVLLISQNPENLPFALAVVLLCLPLMVLTLLPISEVKVEPNKLTLKAFFEQRELSARRIKDIKMETVTGKRGRVRNYVVIVSAEGKQYSLRDFPESEEQLYGFLANWWDANKNR